MVAANTEMALMLGQVAREKLLRAEAADFFVDPRDHRRIEETLNTEGIVRNYRTELCRSDGARVAGRVQARVLRRVGRGRLYEAVVEDLSAVELESRTVRPEGTGAWPEPMMGGEPLVEMAWSGVPT